MHLSKETLEGIHITSKLYSVLPGCHYFQFTTLFITALSFVEMTRFLLSLDSSSSSNFFLSE